MIRHIAIATLCLLACFCTAWAQDGATEKGPTHLVALENKGNTQDSRLVDCEYAVFTFRLLNVVDGKAKVKVSVENRTPTTALLLYKYDLPADYIGRNKPKVEFAKGFTPQLKTKVRGYELMPGNLTIMPSSTYAQDLFVIEVPANEPVPVSIPYYAATIDGQGDNIKSLQIVAEDIPVFKIAVAAWSTTEPQYAALEQAVAQLEIDLRGKKLCTDKGHTPAFTEAWDPYQQRIDSIGSAINAIVAKEGWSHGDVPYLAYDKLRERLAKFNAMDYAYICPTHLHPIIPAAEEQPAAQQAQAADADQAPAQAQAAPAQPVHTHKCNYCSKSAVGLFQEMERTYTLLYNGTSTKQNAMAAADAIMKCFNQKPRSDKEAVAAKISQTYDKIKNY